jgi:phospholipid transport system substrate-binding protein
MKRVSLTVCLILFVFSVFAVAASASPGPITDNLKTVVDKLLMLLKDPAYGAPEKKSDRDKLIHETASGTFDWEEMARRTLGPHWREFDAQQQKQFTDTFVGFLERTYISKIDAFLQGAKGFTTKDILYLNETVEQERYAIIETKIQLNEKDLPLNYKLLQKNGKWVVYDITIEGVGLVANYRTQFNEILANGSFKTLIDKLRSKEGVPIADKKIE